MARICVERERRGWLVRAFTTAPNRYEEIAYAVIGIRGPTAEIEFPSDWHEYARAWVRLGCGFFTLAFSFPWSKVVPDEHQCSGPRYGFYFFEDHLVLLYGKGKGTRDDPAKFIYMPWKWTHREHLVLSNPEQHPYRYTLRSGEVQLRTATITSEQRTWTRWWLPWRKVSRYINVEFDGEVGERSGSWKGGCTGCSYEMLPNESQDQTLRRMERERKFT